MDPTIRNLYERAYRALRARAVLEGRTVGELNNEAIEAYLLRVAGSFCELKPEPLAEGNDRLSSEVDLIVYGWRQ